MQSSECTHVVVHACAHHVRRQNQRCTKRASTRFAPSQLSARFLPGASVTSSSQHPACALTIVYGQTLVESVIADNAVCLKLNASCKSLATASAPFKLGKLKVSSIKRRIDANSTCV
jgi:hypothetical protein